MLDLFPPVGLVIQHDVASCSPDVDAKGREGHVDRDEL